MNLQIFGIYMVLDYLLLDFYMLIVLHRCLFPGVPRNVKRDMQKGKKESTNAVSHVKSVQMELMSTEQVGFLFF